MKKIRQLLDSITSYRVVLYALIFLTGATFALSALNILEYSSFRDLAITINLIAAVCFVTNTVLGKLYGVATNHESSIITTLILFFVLSTPSSKVDYVGIAFASLVAIASKYVITWRSAHIFNPAAFGVLVVSLMGIGSGAWWIASSVLFIPMLIAGLVVLLKTRQFQLFLTFFIIALSLIVFRTVTDSNLGDALLTAVTLYPLLFFGTIMLTEPATMPQSHSNRLIFSALVALIFALNVDIAFLAASPHQALIIGNLFAFAVSRRSSAKLRLSEIKKMTPTTYSYSFTPSRPIHHIAGQYMDLTLPGVMFDARGNRRTFTIASAPADKEIKVGVKFYEKGSRFKSKLRSLKVGDEIMGSHVAGDFTLPRSAKDPLVFIAGGIGITPFIAMIHDMHASGKKYEAVLYYFVSDKTEIAYIETLKLAKSMGINVSLREGRDSRLTDEDIAAHAGAVFYLSGPPGLVGAYKSQLKNAGVKKIHVDYFTGY